MGLRTASVGRPNAPKDMAPALSEPQPAEPFGLSSHDSQVNKTKQPLSYKSQPTRNRLSKPLEAPTYEKGDFTYRKIKDESSIYSDHSYSPPKKIGKVEEPLSPINTDDLSTQFNLEEFSSLQKKQPPIEQYLSESSSASDNHLFPQNMSEGPASQDHPKMGLHKTEPLTNNLNKAKTPNEIDQLFDANVEDIMQQVMKHIDGDQLNNSSSDLNEVLDLNLDKDLLDNIDMNISIDDQQDDELETTHKIKENEAKNILSDLQKRHAKIERRLDFLRRRAGKLQSRYMAQHVSGEISGVFEHVQRTLKRSKIPEQTALFSSASSSQDVPEKLKPLSVHSAKSLAKKLESATALQANTAARQRNIPKYFGSGSIETSASVVRAAVSSSVNIPTWSANNRQELQKVSEQLQTQLRVVQKAVDSEATESSSGGESCDEMQVYNNPHQQYLSVQKRALWRYSQDRAAIAARWTWLQSQISDLEYRIRQHTDLHRQIRTAKGPVQLAENPPLPSVEEQSEGTCAASTVNGYRGQLPGATPSVSGKGGEQDTECQHCARTRPVTSFRKRKLLQVPGLHAISKKAARPSTVRCSCIPPSTSCALCTGRTDPTYPRDPPDSLGRTEKVSRLDPAFHPVLSLPEDSSQSLHLEAIMKMFEWQQRSSRIKTVKALSKEGRVDSKTSLDPRQDKEYKYKKKYKYGKLKSSTAVALSEKIKKKLKGKKGRPLKYKKHRDYDSKPIKDNHTFTSVVPPSVEDTVDAEVEATMESGMKTPLLDTTRSSFDSPGGSPLLQMQSISGFNRQHRNSRIDSYDIDNIVIPYSVAASTRVEKLEYKEILTPKWRIADADYPEVSDKPVPDFSLEESDVEDVSEDSVAVRHERSEQEERKKFLSYLKLPFGSSRHRSHKRQDSMAESSGGNTPDPMSPHPPSSLDVPPESPVAVEIKPNGSGTAENKANGSSTAISSSTTIGSGSQVGQSLEDGGSLPSIALMRRRTISQSRLKEVKEEPGPPPDFVEAPPYETRSFPIQDGEYDGMVKEMPETHQAHQTNTRAQDFGMGSMDDGGKSVDSGDTESTESAIGEDCEEDLEDMDDEEDPNDPEWIDVEKAAKDKHHHRR